LKKDINIQAGAFGRAWFPVRQKGRADMELYHDAFQQNADNMCRSSILFGWKQRARCGSSSNVPRSYNIYTNVWGGGLIAKEHKLT